MGTTENVQAWSKTAATNSSADAGVNWAEGQDPASVNNSARGMMAATKKWAEDFGGALAAGGSANALTVTTKQVLSSGHVTDGLRILLKATADNSSATVTFAPDSLTAANIKRADGSALAVGSIKSGMYLDLVYNSGSSEWRCANIPPAAAGLNPSAAASFFAYASADQTVAAGTVTVTLGTELYDNGSLFATNAWTPPIGRSIMTASVYIASGMTVGNNIDLRLTGNAGNIYEATAVAPATGDFSVPISVVHNSTAGTEAFSLVIVSTDTSYVIKGTAVGTVYRTFFSGSAL